MHLLIQRFIQDAGHMTQSLGLGRVTGQIYAYLYLSKEPRNLADMQSALGISKGSASTVVRQLEQWAAVKKVWVKGDRRDYYTASDWFGNIIKNAVFDTMGKKLTSYAAMLDEIETELTALPGGNGERDFLRDRIGNLRRFQKRAQGVWDSPVLRLLMK